MNLLKMVYQMGPPIEWIFIPSSVFLTFLVVTMISEISSHGRNFYSVYPTCSIKMLCTIYTLKASKGGRNKPAFYFAGVLQQMRIIIGMAAAICIWCQFTNDLCSFILYGDHKCVPKAWKGNSHHWSQMIMVSILFSHYKD